MHTITAQNKKAKNVWFFVKNNAIYAQKSANKNCFKMLATPYNIRDCVFRANQKCAKQQIM